MQKRQKRILSIKSKNPHGNTLKRIRTFTLVPFMALVKDIFQFLSLEMDHLKIHLAIKRPHVLLSTLDYFEQISRPYSPNKGIAKHNTKKGCDEDGLIDADELEISLANAVVILTKILQKLKEKEVK